MYINIYVCKRKVKWFDNEKQPMSIGAASGTQDEARRHNTAAASTEWKLSELTSERGDTRL